MVGDRRFDIEAAHANQLASMGVLYGFGTESELRAVSPDALFDTVDTLAAEVLRRAADSPRGATGV
jgi:phosphoglycolate phosphatase